MFAAGGEQGGELPGQRSSLGDSGSGEGETVALPVTRALAPQTSAYPIASCCPKLPAPPFPARRRAPPDAEGKRGQRDAATGSPVVQTLSFRRFTEPQLSPGGEVRRQGFGEGGGRGGKAANFGYQPRTPTEGDVPLFPALGAKR